MEVINTLDLAARKTATASASRTYAIDATDNFPCVLSPPGFPGSTSDSPPTRRVESDPEGNDVFMAFPENATLCSEDVDILLEELDESGISIEVAAFLMKQKDAKLRTWDAIKRLRKLAQNERGYHQSRVNRLVQSGHKQNRAPFRKRLSIQEVKQRTKCMKCGKKRITSILYLLLRLKLLLERLLCNLVYFIKQGIGIVSVNKEIPMPVATSARSIHC